MFIGSTEFENRSLNCHFVPPLYGVGVCFSILVGVFAMNRKSCDGTIRLIGWKDKERAMLEHILGLEFKFHDE